MGKDLKSGLEVRVGSFSKFASGAINMFVSLFHSKDDGLLIKRSTMNERGVVKSDMDNG